MYERNKVRNGLVLAAAFLLLLAPAMVPAFASSTASSNVKLRGIWLLPDFNATVLGSSGNVQYIASYGSGPFTGGITGNSTASLLLQSNNVTNVITFTQQIFCVCKIDGRRGDLW